MCRRRQACLHIAPFTAHLPPRFALCSRGGKRQTRHRTDTGQRLATKPQAGNTLEIFKIADFAGCVATHCQRHVVFVDTVAIVAKPNKLDAARLHIQFNFRGTGVQTVFQQLFHHRGGAFDHLAGGDLVGEPGIE